MGAGWAATELRLGGSRKLRESLVVRTSVGSTMGFFLTVLPITLGTVVDRTIQLSPETIFVRRSRTVAQVFVGIAEGSIWELGQLAVHSPVTWKRKHMGRSVLAT
jgi:hypothetical protein